MPIALTCPNGHCLTAKESNAGKAGKCPVCLAPVLIPVPPKRETAGSSIVAALLGELNAEAASQLGKTIVPSVRTIGIPRPSGKTADVRICPNCERDIDAGYQVCPYCRAYLSGLHEF
ncbi:MAG: hypothetical protein LBH00_04505 [Planctomycetaceae bacterium]|jgi:hypothetical protein|nr:hypothetical protein [Planctomycetaceae bacterium]